MSAVFRCLRSREPPGTPASQGDDLRKEVFAPLSPRAKWPEAGLEPRSWEVDLPLHGVGCLAGEESSQRRRWWRGSGKGWRCTLAASQGDSEPLLAPAFSRSASCSFGFCRRGCLFTSPPGLRPGRRGAVVCLFPPPLPLLLAQGWETRSSGLWVSSLSYFPDVPSPAQHSRTPGVSDR